MVGVELAFKKKVSNDQPSVEENRCFSQRQKKKKVKKGHSLWQKLIAVPELMRCTVNRICLLGQKAYGDAAKCLNPGMHLRCRIYRQPNLPTV